MQRTTFPVAAIFLIRAKWLARQWVRVNYSAGFDDNPYGWQQMWVPGVTVALTKNVDFYIDLVRWDVYNNANAVATNGHREIEDGVSFVINWRF